MSKEEVDQAFQSASEKVESAYNGEVQQLKTRVDKARSAALKKLTSQQPNP